MKVDELLSLEKTKALKQLPAVCKKLNKDYVSELYLGIETSWPAIRETITNANTQRNYMQALKNAFMLPEVEALFENDMYTHLTGYISEEVRVLQRKANDKRRDGGSEQDDDPNYVRGIYDYLQTEVMTRDAEIDHLRSTLALKDHEIKILKEVIATRLG